MRDLLEVLSVILDLCENYGRTMEVEISTDRRIVKGELRRVDVRRNDIYVLLYNSEVNKNGEIKKYHKVRIPLFTKECKYRFL